LWGLEWIVESALGNILSRVGEVGVELFGGGASISNVCSEHGWESVELVRATADGDLGAVHVHFSVANVVEPSPCENGTAILDF